jgi:hypothetical protein
MAWTTTYKNIFIDYIRMLLSDKDKLIFSDDELEGIIERFTEQTPVTSNASVYGLKYKIEGCCSDPIKDLTVTSGDTGAVYLIDEWSGTIYLNTADPDYALVGTPNPITVEYWEVDINGLMRELCIIISNSTTKLATIQSIGGLSINSSQLSSEYNLQAQRWACRGDCC